MNWQTLILDPLGTLLSHLAVFIPKLLVSILLVGVGWGIAALLRKAVVELLEAIGLNRLAEKSRLSDVLRKGGIRLSVGELLGQLCYWMVLIATLIITLQYLGVTVASEWLERFGYFIPRIIVSIVTLLFGMLLAAFLSATVRAASLNAGFPNGQLLGQVIYVMIVTLAAIVSLEQLQVVTQTIQVALYIVMGATGLAAALAVGLGSQDFVRKSLEAVWKRWKGSQSS